MTFAIVSTILLIFASLALVIVGRVTSKDPSQRLLTRICRGAGGGVYALIIVSLILWVIQAYEGLNVTLAVWTYIVAWLMYGGVLALIGIPTKSKLFYVPLVLTFALAVTFIILQIFLSKSILQPNVAALALFF